MAEVSYRWGRTGGYHSGRHAFRASCDQYPACLLPSDEVKLPDAPGLRIDDDTVAGAGASGPEEVTPWTASYRPPPEHYQSAGGVIDPWAIWRAFDLDPWEANLVKYVIRSGKKPGESRLKDLLKAKDYLNYLIEREGSADVRSTQGA